MKSIWLLLIAASLNGCAVAVSCPPTGCVFGGFAGAINTSVDAPAPAVTAPQTEARQRTE